MPPFASALRLRAIAALRHPAAAALATLLWLLGVELLPGLHVALHDQLAHHHHGPADRAHDDDGRHDASAHHAHREDHHHRTAASDHDHHHDPHADHHGDHGHRRTAPAAHHGEHAEDHEHHVHHEDHHAHRAAAAPTDHAPDHDGATPTTEALASTSDEHARRSQPSLRAPGHRPHGEGSIAHRDVVPLTPPAALPPGLLCPSIRAVVLPSPRQLVQQRAPQILRARGPPSSLDIVAPKLA